MAEVRWGHLRRDPQELAKLRGYFDDPKRKGAATRALRKDADAIIMDMVNMAYGELHHRPQNRRTAESLAHGKHYHESFQVKSVGMKGRGLAIEIENTHPFAAAVERGTPGHSMPVSGSTKMIFPYNGSPGGHGGPRVMGPWPITGPPFGGAWNLWHPGAAAHHIMADAMRNYRRRFRRSLGEYNV